MLLEAIFGDLRSDEGILVFSPKPHKRVLARSIPEVLTLAQSMDSVGADAYYGVAPRHCSDVEKVTRVPMVWLDIDLKDLPRGLEGFEDLCKQVALPPTLRVFSGHGFHLYWKLKTDAEPEPAGELMKALWRAYGEGAGGRTYNAKWLLRVPGTTNYKDPEAPVRVVEQAYEPRAVYRASDISVLTRLPKAAARSVWTEENGSFKSRSERDYWVISELLRAGASEEAIHTLFQVAPVCARAATRGGAGYVDRTIESARTRLPKLNEASPPEADMHDPARQFVERDGRLFFKTSKGYIAVATFVFRPHKLIKVAGSSESVDAGDSGEDILLGDIAAYDNLWRDVMLPRSAFNSASALARSLPTASWQWTGGDREVRAYLPYLMEQLYAQGLPHARGVVAVGRHGDYWVHPGGCFSAEQVCLSDEAPYVLVDTNRERPEVSYTFPERLEYDALVRNISCLLPQINSPEAIAPIIGWFCASPLKPVLEKAGIRFPHLALYGTQGSGKSSTILRVCQRLMGWQTPRAHASQTRLFVMLALLASSNAVPISFGEFRDSTAARGHDEFLDLLRRAYDVGRDARGRPDQSTRTYELSAPICVDGEDAFSDAAVRERSIIVHMSVDACVEQSLSAAAFQELVKLPLPDFAGRYIQRTLQETESSVVKTFTVAMQDLHADLPHPIPDRVRRNLAVVRCGLQLYNVHVRASGGKPLELTSQTWKWILEGTLLGASAGRTRVLVDDFVEDVIAYARMVPHTPAFLMRYDAERNTLWFHLSAAVGWWAQKRRREGRVLLQIQAIRAQFRELENAYTCAETLIHTGVGLQRLVGVRVAHAEAQGLDVPQELKPFQDVTISV